MPRPIWNGSIAFGLVNVPVKLFSATSPKDVRFHQLRRSDASRVRQKRVSAADPRPRHQGVSHHSLTSFGRVALARADVAVPQLPGPFGEQVAAQAAPLAARHDLIGVPVDGLMDALAACPVPLSAMGRGLADDPAYFLAAAAAGRHAARLARAR